MNKKRKKGIILIITPIALFLLSFILTAIESIQLDGLVVEDSPIKIAGVSIAIYPLILLLLALISMTSFPILVTIGIIMIVKNKDGEVGQQNTTPPTI